MTRPKHADSTETWERILDAAKALVRDDGEGGVDLSLRDVAKRAGCSLGTIHYYFQSKEALLESCLDTYYDELRRVASGLAAVVREARREEGPDIIDRGVRGMYRFALMERSRLKLRVLANAARGHTHPHRDPGVLAGHYIDWFVPILLPLVDVDMQEMRLAMQSMTLLVVQYVLLQDADVEKIAGAAGEEGRQRIEDHVVRAAKQLVFRRAL